MCSTNTRVELIYKCKTVDITVNSFHMLINFVKKNYFWKDKKQKNIQK